jgi:hypothetical protein
MGNSGQTLSSSLTCVVSVQRENLGGAVMAKMIYRHLWQTCNGFEHPSALDRNRIYLGVHCLGVRLSLYVCQFGLDHWSVVVEYTAHKDVRYFKCLTRA